MRLLFTSVLFITAILLFGFQKQRFSFKPSPQTEIIGKAQRLIKEYHSGTAQAKCVVKVVYFHGKDQAPLVNWKERLTRTLADISDFFKEEFYKHGVQIQGIPFEQSEGDFVFHVVEGDLVAQRYTVDFGLNIQKEIHRKSNGKIDFEKDFVLVINSLSYQRKDGTYVLHSPYYGKGNSTYGISQVVDIELLDSKLLKDTIQRVMYSELLVDHRTCSYAEFNSWYIGGIAHELGHVFGLPHDFGQPTEIGASTISLMGEFGSHHFRDYLWRGEKSAVLSSASIFQLMSHPIFTQSNKSRGIDKGFNLEGLKFRKNDKGVVLNAKVTAEELPYGAVALIRPSYVSEYFNQGFFNVVSGVDSVSIELGKLSEGNYNLHFLFLFPNGATRQYFKVFMVDNSGNAMEDGTSRSGTVDVKKLYAKLQMEEKTKEVKRKLKILRGIINPPLAIDPRTYTGNTLILSEAKWEKAGVGWQNVARNQYTCEGEFTFFLELQGQLYSNGLYAHSPSFYVFNLNRRWKTFSAVVGLRDYAHPVGSARFTVIGDGKVLYTSGVLRVNQKDNVSVDISDVNTLELRASGTEGHIDNSWAIWVDPIIKR